MIEMNNEEAMLLVCLNNQGVRAFERGNLQKAMKLFRLAVVSSAAALEGSNISKKHALKLAKCKAKALHLKSFQIQESSMFSNKKDKNSDEQPVVVRQPETEDKASSSSVFAYRRSFRIKACSESPILEQTSAEQLTGIVLLNISMCHHVSATSCNDNDEEQQHALQATHYYEMAFSALCTTGDLLLQLVIWNNMFQLHSMSHDSADIAQVCQIQLGDKIGQLHSRGMLQKLKGKDRRGFMRNLRLFTTTALIAAAA